MKGKLHIKSLIDKCIFIFCTFCLSQFAIAQQPANAPDKTPETPKATTVQTVKDFLKKLQNEADFKNATLGFSLKSLSQEKPLVDVNASKSMAVASNAKIVTTSTALAILGEDYTYKTILEYTGKIDATGMLDGDLIIRGSGDPSLGSERLKGIPDMQAWLKLLVDKVKLQKIKRIKGHIIIDQDIFDQNPLCDSWMWMDMGNYFGAGAYGLNINENLYRLYFVKNTVVGSPAVIAKTDPSIADLQWQNSVKIAEKSSGDNCYIYGGPYTNFHIAQGTIPVSDVNFWVKGAIPDPPQLVAQYFNNMLQVAGVSSGGYYSSRLMLMQGKTMPPIADRKMIFTYTSPALKEMVNVTNQFSINLYAEAFLKTLAQKKYNNGSETTGTKVLEEYWKEKGLKMGGFSPMDGCGLSAMTTYTPDQLTDVLKITAGEKYFATFNASLPLAGATGTLAGMCKGTKAENNVRAKSGNMQKVISYAGYVTNSAGEKMCFAFVLNNFTADNVVIKKRVEKLMVLLAEMR